MTKIRTNQTNFTAGELSPRLRGRTDLSKYSNSARTIENFLVTPHGGVRKRPGFQYLETVKDSESPPILIPFKFNNEDTYMIEAGDAYFRFLRNGSYVKERTNTSNWNTSTLTDYDPADGWYDLTSNSDDLQLTGWRNRIKYPIANVTDNSSGTGTISTDAQSVYIMTSGSAGNEGSVAIELNVDNNTTDAVFGLVINKHRNAQTGTWALGTSAGDNSIASGNIDNTLNAVNNFTPATDNFWLTLTGDANTTIYISEISIIGYSTSGNTGETFGGTFSRHYEGFSVSGAAAGDNIITPEFTEADYKDATAQYTTVTTVHCAQGNGAYKITDGSSFSDTEIASGTIAAGETKAISATAPVNDVYYVHFYSADEDLAIFRAIDIYYGEDPYEISTPYSYSDLPNLNWTQTNDVMILTHRNHPPQKLTRTAHSDWTIEEYTILDGPYLQKQQIYPGEAQTSESITISGTSATFSSTTLSASDVGRLFRWRKDTTEAFGYARITSAGTSTTVTFEWVLTPTTSTGASTEWYLQSWGDNPKVGFPKTCAFYEQRLYFGGSKGQPLTLWGSRAGSFDDFSPDNDTNKLEVDDDTAVNFTIAASQGGEIHWLSSRKTLFIGTSIAIFNMRASSQGEAITPSNINIVKETSASVKDAQQIDTDTSVLFTNRYDRSVHELAYNFEADAFQAPDLTILSEHLTHPGIKKIVRQEYPDNIIWLLTTDGNLRTLTYLRDQEVVAWSKHTLGGSPTVLDIQSLPGANEAEVYILTSRTINSSDVVYIERLAPKFDQDDLDDAIFLDCSATYDGSAATTITGLDHLEAESIDVLRDGTVETGLTVSSGDITIAASSSKVHAGYSYDAILETNNLETPQVSIQGRLARVTNAVIRVMETLGGKVGFSSSDTLDSLPYNADDAPLDGNSVRTGDVKLQIPKGFERNTRLYLKFDEPTPATINAIITSVDAGGE